MSTEANIIDTKQSCLGCSWLSHDRKTFKVGYFDYQDTKKGLICESCGTFLCDGCVRLLYPRIAGISRNVHKVCDPYIKNLKHYVDEGRQPAKYIGNCCFIKNLRAKQEVLENTRKVELKNFELQRMKRKSMQAPSTYSTMGGHLCLPEFRLIVETDFKSMDIIGLGGDTLHGKTLKPRYHFVIDTYNAAQLEAAGVQPLFVMPKTWFKVKQKVRMNYPHRMANKSQPLLCSIFFVKREQDADLSVKGSNEISPNDAMSFYYFSPTAVPHSDITIVIGYDDGQDLGSILLFRYHNHLKAPYLNQKEKRKLFFDIQSTMKNDGLERRRSGGSSGFFRYSMPLLKMMSTHNSTPKKSKAVIYLPHVNDLGLHTFYFDGQKGEGKNDVKYVCYATPVVGGSVEVQQDWLAGPKYKFLLDFIITKPFCAKIIAKLQHNLNKRNDLVDKQLPSWFCPTSVTTELLCLDRTASFVDKFYPDVIEDNDRKLIFYSLFSKLFLRYTMVCHPVGRHFDTFADKSPSLENRICFGFNANNFKYLGFGRGGLGGDIFTFALLDWKAGGLQKRCIWSDPKNGHLVDSLHDRQRQNPSSNPPNLTQTIWNNFKTKNSGKIVVPDGVVLDSLK